MNSPISARFKGGRVNRFGAEFFLKVTAMPGHKRNKLKRPLQVGLRKRAKEFGDTERELFVKDRVVVYPKNKKWVAFSWIELVQFFGLEQAFKITRELGGKIIYPSWSKYRPRSREWAERKKSSFKWFPVRREDLKERVGEEVTKLIYQYFSQTYIRIPSYRLFQRGEEICFERLQEETIQKIQKIYKKLNQGESNKNIADSLGISLQLLAYYIKTYFVKR